MTPKQSEAITAVMTEVLNDSLENVGQTFTSVYEMQRVSLILLQWPVLRRCIAAFSDEKLFCRVVV